MWGQSEADSRLSLCDKAMQTPEKRGCLQIIHTEMSKFTSLKQALQSKKSICIFHSTHRDQIIKLRYK